MTLINYFTFAIHGTNVFGSAVEVAAEVGTRLGIALGGTSIRVFLIVGGAPLQAT